MKYEKNWLQMLFENDRRTTDTCIYYNLTLYLQVLFKKYAGFRPRSSTHNLAGALRDKEHVMGDKEHRCVITSIK